MEFRIMEKLFESKEKPIQSTFRLPISYLDESKKFELSEIIAKDLELSQEKNMYSYLLESPEGFAKSLLPQWRHEYTTDTEFLTDTQDILRGMNVVAVESIPDETVEFHWKQLGEDCFLEKYGYMEWDSLEQFNRSSEFLQSITMIHIISPIMSFFVPILFLIFPFIILQIQGIPIDFLKYIEVLKSIARHHFIGKALMTFDSFSFESFMYLVGTFGLYALQMYQNTTQCIRFYQNTQYINTALCEWKQYVNDILPKMKYVLQSFNKNTYRPFLKTVERHYAVLEKIKEELTPVLPFEMSVFKVTEIGYMLKTFYLLRADPEYQESLLYSMGFKGFLCHMQQIARNVSEGVLGYATFVDEDQTIVQQYYPPHHSEKICIKNDAELDNHLIITGPNASGKTTFLKTTALNIIFSQQFGVGFYDSCKIRPYTHFHSYLNIPDTSGRDSLFQAESRRCKEILDKISQFPKDKGFSHFCIFDELYSGTNPIEATKSAYAFLKYLAETHTHVRFLLTTHYTSICDKWGGEEDPIQNYQMEVESDFTNTYKIKKGVSTIQGAVRILREMEYPDEILLYIQDYE